MLPFSPGVSRPTKDVAAKPNARKTRECLLVSYTSIYIYRYTAQSTSPNRCNERGKYTAKSAIHSLMVQQQLYLSTSIPRALTRLSTRSGRKRPAPRARQSKHHLLLAIDQHACIPAVKEPTSTSSYSIMRREPISSSGSIGELVYVGVQASNRNGRVCRPPSYLKLHAKVERRVKARAYV